MGYQTSRPTLLLTIYMAMGYFYYQITKAISDKLWTPFKQNDIDLTISHLFFVDDILLFVKVDSNTIQTIKNTIHSFYETSGMNINFEKSKIWLSPSITPKRKKHHL